jgi:polyphosphate kinase
MGRNLNNRVELIVPVEDALAQAELIDTLDRCFADDTYAWDLSSDGDWTRRDGRTRSVHTELMERALTRVRQAEGPVRSQEDPPLEHV